MAQPSPLPYSSSLNPSPVPPPSLSFPPLPLLPSLSFPLPLPLAFSELGGYPGVAVQVATCGFCTLSFKKSSFTFFEREKKTRKSGFFVCVWNGVKLNLSKFRFISENAGNVCVALVTRIVLCHSMRTKNSKERKQSRLTSGGKLWKARSFLVVKHRLLSASTSKFCYEKFIVAIKNANFQNSTH